MPHARYSSAEIVQRGQVRYDQRIRAQVDTCHQGPFLVLNIETGDDAIDADDVRAVQRAKTKHPDAALSIVWIGSLTAYRFGAQPLGTPP